MKSKVRQALAIYQEGGTVKQACGQIGISWVTFYAAMNSDPALEAEYRGVQKNRADMYVDEAYFILTDTGTEPKRVRAVVDGLVKLAGLYDRSRFGERVQVDVNHQLDFAGAFARVRERLQPLRDLGVITDAKYEVIAGVLGQRATDRETVALPELVAAPAINNVFED